MAHKNIPSTGGLNVEWFGPGFGWTTSKKVSEWWEKAYDRYAKGDGRLKVQADARYGGLLRYEARLDAAIDRLTSG